jgi:hypothetical protein
MKQFIKVYKDAYSTEFCDKVIESWEKMAEAGEVELGAKKEGKPQDWSDVTFRCDKAIFMDLLRTESPTWVNEEKIDLSEEFFKIILEYVVIYLKEVGQYENFYLSPMNMKVQKYPAAKGGGYYKFHFERTCTSTLHMRRVLTYLLYLNDIPEGEGETEFLYQGCRYQPKKGTLVIFPADFTYTHRGNPVYTTDKYIATGWMLEKEWMLENDLTEEAENNQS